MTLTNHTRRIEELAGDVVRFADAREYENAHLALDTIVMKVQELRRYIEHLQWMAPRVPGPAGENAP